MKRIRVLYPAINSELYEWLDKFRKGKAKPYIVDPCERLLIALHDLGMIKNILATWYQVNYDDLED